MDEVEIKGHKFGEILLTVETRDGQLIEVKEFDDMATALTDINRRLMFVQVGKRLINAEEIKYVTIL